MAAAARARATEVEPEPIIIVKRIASGDHGEAHNGGAWKIAYADFVTAMMAFFMLLWIVGATTETQRKGIADYFSPTVIKMIEAKGGSNGVLAGRSIRDDRGGQPASASGAKGMIPSLFPRDVGTGREPALDSAEAAARQADRAAFGKVEALIARRLAADPSLAELRRQIRFVETREGLRIEIIDRAGFSMFELGTDRLAPRAARLMAIVAKSVDDLPNPIAVRGHTDALRYSDPGMNNWKLSSGRAEATRAAFAAAGIPEERFARVEGVADREPFIAAAPTDARNRRITVTLFHRKP